jgi:hypothetical protein
VAKSVYLTIEIKEGHETDCPGSLPDRCKRNSVTGHVVMSDALLSASLPEMAKEMVRDHAVEMAESAWERFVELRAARDQS